MMQKYDIVLMSQEKLVGCVGSRKNTSKRKKEKCNLDLSLMIYEVDVVVERMTDLHTQSDRPRFLVVIMLFLK